MAFEVLEARVASKVQLKLLSALRLTLSWFTNGFVPEIGATRVEVQRRDNSTLVVAMPWRRTSLALEADLRFVDAELKTKVLDQFLAEFQPSDAPQPQ